MGFQPSWFGGSCRPSSPPPSSHSPPRSARSSGAKYKQRADPNEAELGQAPFDVAAFNTLRRAVDGLVEGGAGLVQTSVAEQQLGPDQSYLVMPGEQLLDALQHGEPRRRTRGFSHRHRTVQPNNR